MKRLGMIIGIGITLVLFTGCGQPQFNPNYMNIVMVEGDAFRVPKGSIVNRKKYYNTPNIVASVEQNRRLGLDCKIGDLGWSEYSTRMKFQEATKGLPTNSPEGFKRIENLKREAINSGKMGCAHPLTDREYDFYRSQEMDASANARADSNSRAAAANMIAASTPQTVNVNHSGYVNQNVNVSGTINQNVNVTSNPYYRY